MTSSYSVQAVDMSEARLKVWNARTMKWTAKKVLPFSLLPVTTESFKGNMRRAHLQALDEYSWGSSIFFFQMTLGGSERVNWNTSNPSHYHCLRKLPKIMFWRCNVALAALTDLVEQDFVAAILPHCSLQMQQPTHCDGVWGRVWWCQLVLLFGWYSCILQNNYTLHPSTLYFVYFKRK